MRWWHDLPAGPRRGLVLVLHVLATGAVGIADYVSGPDLELRPFYLLPVVSAAWYLGGRSAVVVSAAAAISYFFANDYAFGSPTKDIGVTVWNNLARLGTYGLVAVLAGGVRSERDRVNATNQELVREAERRDEYVALFVHELRHSAATMSLAAASVGSSPAFPDAERSFLMRLRDQASGLEDLAAQLLTIGRVEGTDTASEIDLRDLATSVVTDHLTEQRIELRSPPHPVIVRGDQRGLQTALRNYVRNALRFSEPGSPVSLELIERDGWAGVQVSDQGVGIPPAEEGQLFQKYSRLSTGRAVAGAGLGLYLVRLIIEAHGGSVQASSPGPGRGSTFSFLVPRAPASSSH